MTINVKNITVTYPSTFSTTSTSYTDLLDGSGGAAISVTITKSAGTNILIRGGATYLQNSAATTATLGVHDGSTTTDICRTRNESASHGLLVGATILTGLPAGTYTFKLRIKLGAANSAQFTTNHSAFLTAMEVSA